MGRAILAMNIQALEMTETLTFYLVIVSILFVSLLSAISIAVIARRIVKPVSELAREVQRLEPTQRNFKFSASYRDYEVDLIAKAFKRFFSGWMNIFFESSLLQPQPVTNSEHHWQSFRHQRKSLNRIRSCQNHHGNP